MSISLKNKAAEAVEHVENVQVANKARKLVRFVPKKLSRPVSMASLRVQKNSPQLLFGAGVVLGVATVVTACKATLELPGIIEDLESDLTDIRQLTSEGKLELNDSVKMQRYVRVKGAARVVKLYGPSFGLGVMAVASLTGSHHILNKRNVALTTAYAAMEKSFDEYRERVVEKYGEEADRNLAYGVEERTIVEVNDETGETKKKRVKGFGKGRSKYARVFDNVTSSAWQNNAWSNRTFVLTQQRWANDLLNTQGYLFLNDVYKMLGLQPTAAGQIVGWVLGNGDSVVDFGILDKAHTDERVHEFMFGEEKSVLLDFNVDGPVYKLLDALNSDKN